MSTKYQLKLAIRLFLFSGVLLFVVNVIGVIMDIKGIKHFHLYKNHNSESTNLSPCPSVPPGLERDSKEIKHFHLYKNHNSESTNLSPCPSVPPGLVGPIEVSLDAPSFNEIEKLYPWLELGGHGAPKNCRALHRVAIIVPYRDREKHLRTFIRHIHPFLQKQQLDYAIVVVEQVGNQTYNKAKLINVGFVEAMKMYPWQCFIIHDVDMIPENDRNLYNCPKPEAPRHLGVAIDKFNYTLFYEALIGGASAFTVEQFQKINGMSNEYYGWGGEDDDLYKRIIINGYNITRYPKNISRYKMFKHTRDQGNPINKCRKKLLKLTNKRFKLDGLSSLRYKMKKIELFPLYTHILVDLLEEESKIILEKEIKCEESISIEIKI